MPIKQENRLLAISTALGSNVLAVRSFAIQEQLGRLFQIDAELSSESGEIDLNKVIGHPASIRLSIGQKDKRFFSGFVSRLVQTANHGGYAQYRATMVPWLWFLTRTSDCRIFQDKTVPEIVEEVFKGHGFTDYQLKLSGTYPKWEYCVQYRETDFNFVSRLMEQEGIYYFFNHEDGKHTLVLADSISAHQPFAGYSDIPFYELEKGAPHREAVVDWSVEKEVQTVAYALTDFDFKKPRTSLLSNSNVSRDYGKAQFEIYDFPGEYVEHSDGERLADVRINELQTQYETVRGQATARGIAAGATFKLKHHPRGDQNREYLVTGVSLQANAGEFAASQDDSGEFFTCHFTAIEKSQQFRPARITPKPVVQGPQTAIVSGPKGEEIYTDKYGRVKVQFHWDRYGKEDQNSSCWIRVAQSWAGKKWGAMFIPRISQEVIVEFLEGDPDRPLITGSVYNEEQKVPYDLPAEMTKSAVKSNSTKGGVGFNEIRIEDKKGKEQIFIHAERNMDTRVKNDSMEHVVVNRNLIVGSEKDGSKKGDQREMVYKDKHLKVHGNQVEHIGGDMQLLVGGVDSGQGNQDIVLKGVKKELVQKDSHLHVKGKRNEKVDGDQSLTVGGSQQEKAGKKHALEAGQEIHLKAGMKVIIEAGLQLTLKGPGGFVDIGPAGVTIQGTMVLINSGGAAGSGSGSSPSAPEDAKEAKPTEPDKADDAQTGQKSARS